MMGGVGKFVADGAIKWVNEHIFGIKDSPNGSSTRFDGGGLLKRHTGPFPVEHYSTKPDAVLTDSEWRTMTQIAENARGGGGDLTGNLYLDTGEFLGVVRGAVGRELDGASRDAARRRAGVRGNR